MHPLHQWLYTPRQRRQVEMATLFAKPWPPATDYIELVKAPEDWGIFASIGPHFQYAIFGRDAIETAEDIIETHPKLVHDIITTLCRLQGTKTDYMSEEEPGKIHHEHRNRQLDGFTIPEESERILHDLQHIWGGEDTDQMTYYGTHDATPLFVRLVGSYVDRYGETILHETTTDGHGRPVPVSKSVLAALGWIGEKITMHPLGLFTYKRLSPNGLINQSWKDSYTSYLHTDGSLPNFEGGIASIELQGYAYDALLTGIHLHLGSPADRRRWKYLATLLQQSVITSFWLDDSDYFAQGLDVDADSRPRQIATITSNVGALLDSQLLYDLPEAQTKRFVQSIAKMLYSPELLTGIGIRCRAVRHWDLLDFIDYHGPNTVWPKETFDIAKGLRRAGFPHLAKDLENKLINSLRLAGEFYEFFYVSRDGTVWYDRDEALIHFSAESLGHHLPSPERGQAWTIAAAIRILFEHSQQDDKETLPSNFEQSLLKEATELSPSA